MEHTKSINIKISILFETNILEFLAEMRRRGRSLERISSVFFVRTDTIERDVPRFHIKPRQRFTFYDLGDTIEQFEVAVLSLRVKSLTT